MVMYVCGCEGPSTAFCRSSVTSSSSFASTNRPCERRMFDRWKRRYRYCRSLLPSISFHASRSSSPSAYAALKSPRFHRYRTRSISSLRVSGSLQYRASDGVRCDQMVLNRGHVSGLSIGSSSSGRAPARIRWTACRASRCSSSLSCARITAWTSRCTWMLLLTWSTLASANRPISRITRPSTSFSCSEES